MINYQFRGEIMQLKDLKILKELRVNSRMQLKEISRNTTIPISTIYDRMKNNYKNIIKRNTTLLNFDKLGFNAKANICIKPCKQSKKELCKFLENHQNVNSLYKINNGFDYMFECIFANVKELEEFLEQIEENFSIKSKQTYYIVDEILKENFFTNQELCLLTNEPII